MLDLGLRSTHPMHCIRRDCLRNVTPSIRSLNFMVQFLIENPLHLRLFRQTLLLKLQRAQLDESRSLLLACCMLTEVDLLENLPGALFIKSPH